VENGFTVEHQVIRQTDVIRRQQIIRHIGNTHADAENHHQLIFMPPSSSPVFLLISLMFYWYLGTSLQNTWGTFRFTVYYLCGMLGAILAGLITGYATNTYLNL